MGEIRVNRAAYETAAGATPSRREPETKPAIDPQPPEQQPGLAPDQSKINLDKGAASAPILSLDLDEVDKQAEAMIDASSKPGLIYGKNLDPQLLGTRLAAALADPAQAPLVTKTLSLADNKDAICSLLAHTPDDRLKKLAGTSTGKELLTQMYRSLHGVYTSAEECRGQLRIMGVLSPRYGPLAAFEFNPPAAFNAALKANNVKLQKLSDASHLTNTRYDNYEATVKLDSPEQAMELFKKFAAGFNNVGNSNFEAMEHFTLRGGDGVTTQPKVGDIYDIDILGPDNGAVMVGSTALSPAAGHVTIVTITEPPFTGSGIHPENGVREFGFRSNQDGTTTFYTTAASRGSNSIIHLAGGLPQIISDKGLIQGFVDKAVATYGAEVVNPLSYEVADPLMPS